MAMDLDEDDPQLAIIKAQVEEWSSNSNECFTIDLVRGDGSTVGTFQPEFTYPIFGEEEAIFGYQDLNISLSFAAHNLRPHLGISYGKKYKSQGEVRPTDIHAVMKDFLPDAAFSNESRNDALRDGKAADFTPPGEKIHTYTREGRHFEIWCSSLSDPAARQLLENMQVLLPMFVEGGTVLQLEQDWTTQRWKLFLLYSVHPKPASDPTYSPYSLVGYGTSYRIFTLPDRQKPLQCDIDLFTNSTQSLFDFLPPPESNITNDLAPTANPGDIASPLDLPSRERLSQFLVLPPYQHAGHGQELYHAMYTHLSTPQNVREFTVEDPNEAFDDLRDTCDLLHLRSTNSDFATLRIRTDIPASKLDSYTHIPTSLIVPEATRTEIRATTKIEQRQFDRLVEIHTLSFIPPLNRSRNRITRKEKSSNENDRAYYFWRLYVKQRLYIFNRDQLAQLDREERVEKLEAALDGVLGSYEKILEKVQSREEEGGGFGNGNGSAVEGAEMGRVRKGKRKVVEEDEDEDMEVGGGEVNGSKKVKVT